MNRELDEIAKRGYAIDDEENTLGVRCVAGPVQNAEGLVIAAISVSALAPVLSTTAIPAYADELIHFAEELSTTFGCRPQPSPTPDSVPPATEITIPDGVNAVPA